MPPIASRNRRGGGTSRLMVPREVPADYQFKIICYHQTYYKQDGTYVSPRPLVDHATGITHVIFAAIHLNDGPGNITLNDDPMSSSKYNQLWEDMRHLQSGGVRVLGMLGGAARGSFTRLDGSVEDFDSYYLPLQQLLRQYGFDGIDLDVEEPMSLRGIVRLIDRLRNDFGADFIITLAPVATGMHANGHLSGFDYLELERMRGDQIAWYNTQFYCGWSSLPSDLRSYLYIAAYGWPMHKIVLGLCTNPANGPDHVETQRLDRLLALLPPEYLSSFGGIAGWEYFNSLPGGLERPWEWAAEMFSLVIKYIA